MEIAKNSQKPLQTLNKKNWLKEGQKRIKCHKKCALDGPKSRKMPEILFRWYNLRCQKISENTQRSPKYLKKA